MKPCPSIAALAVALAVSLPGGAGLAFAPAEPVGPGEDLSQPQIAQRGGRGGGRGGGRSGGGRSRGSGSRAGGSRSRSASRSGFQGSGGHMKRGSSRPSGGWSNKVGSSSARPSIERSSGSRARSRDLDRNVNRNLNRDVNRDINRNIDRNIDRRVDRRVDVDWNRRIDIGDVNVYPGWARPGWGVARPWNHGWYGGWSDPPWGWWAARTATWGITTLATASIINNAVDNAVASNTQYIVVPNTSYQLLYGSVQPVGSSSVNFAVTAGGSTYQLNADCNRGLLDGRPPDNASEAELLNAACQVAFGSV